MEFMAGGTIAKMADLGYTIREVIATNNERGTLEPDGSTELTAEARREEARRGAKVPGVEPEMEGLGDEDGRVGETRLNQLREHVCQMAMTVADLQVQLTASGLEIPFLREADRKDYRPVIEAQIKAWAASVGRKAGFAYGEEFRRVRFNGIERWARGSESVLPDEL